MGHDALCTIPCTGLTFAEKGGTPRRHRRASGAHDSGEQAALPAPHKMRRNKFQNKNSFRAGRLLPPT